MKKANDRGIGHIQISVSTVHLLPLLASLLSIGPITGFAQPILTSQPTNQVANQGYSASFQVRATGTPPLSYQWNFNAVALGGATASRLTITNAFPANAGDYFVVVADATGPVTSRVAHLEVILPAVLDLKVGPNIRLGDDPRQLPSNQRAQAEPHIIRSFTDPNLMVAIFQEGRFTDGSALDCGYAVSHDGGGTWTRSLIPQVTQTFGGSYERATDPVAAIDRQGNIYLEYLAGDSSRLDVLVSNSTDGGKTFAKPTVIRQATATARQYPDKGWIALDTFPNSPSANRLSVGWTRFEDDATGKTIANHGIQYSYSDDTGKTWSKPKYLSSTNCLGIQPFFLPDGTMAALYWNYVDSFTNSLMDLTNFNHHRIEMVTSSDGGETFTEPRVVTPVRIYKDPVARDGFVLPSVATDRQAGVIYLTYQAKTGPDSNTTPAILFTKSIDRGQTWSTPVSVNDTPNQRSVFTPAVAASPDGQHVTIIFYDKRHDTSDGYLVDLYLAESFDGGDTWEKNLRLSEFSSDLRKAPLTAYGYMFGDYQAIVPALDFETPAVACWIDARSGDPDPFAVRIQRTRDANFQTWRRLRFSTPDLANMALSGLAADPDGDGIPNFSEYALGLEPNHPDTNPLSATLIRDAASGELLQVSFTTPAVVSGFTFSWESSANLVNWQSATPDKETVEGSGFTRTHIAQFPVETAAVKFLRLRVKPPP